MGSVNCMPLVGLKWVLSGYLEWEYWLNIIFGLHFFLFVTQRQHGEGVMMLVSFIFIILCLNEEYYYLLFLPLFIGLKVALYSFSGSIPPKFEHKLCRHKQRFGKIAAKVASDEDENLLWSRLQWHWSCHSNKMTLLPFLLAAVFLGTGICSSKNRLWRRAFSSNSGLDVREV